MAEQGTDGFSFPDGFPPRVIAVVAHGEIRAEHYERDLIPRIGAAVKASGPARLYYELGEDFHGFSLGAAWDDAMVGLRHLSDFARVAVVTDIGWIRSGTALFAPLIPCEVRVFPLAERAAARAWIAA